MAESVDALVSNTSGATRAGSTPALGTKKPLNLSIRRFFFFWGASDELSSLELKGVKGSQRPLPLDASNLSTCQLVNLSTHILFHHHHTHFNIIYRAVATGGF